MHELALSIALVQQEERFFLDQQDPIDLLLELGPLLERFRADAIVREHLDGMQREARELVEGLRAVDDANIKRLVEIRKDFPTCLSEAEYEDGPLHEFSLKNFDRAIERPSSDGAAGIGRRDDRADPSKTPQRAQHLKPALVIDDTKPDPEKDALAARIAVVQDEHAHAFQAFSIRRRTMAGFSLQRLHQVVRQINPPPAAAVELIEYIVDQQHTIIANPELLRALVHDPRRVENETSRRQCAEIAAELRPEVQRVCRELQRRIGSTRSRVALVNAYATRCSWYDAPAMAKLARSVAGKGKQKEDPLSDHLACFLFDHGLRPLTRATVGRLVPDLFDARPLDEPAFYVEAKQYADKKSAKKAVRDGLR